MEIDEGKNGFALVMRSAWLRVISFFVLAPIAILCWLALSWVLLRERV